MSLALTIICGGVSPEHEISLLSAKHVASACRSRGYKVGMLYISQEGQWLYCSDVVDPCEFMIMAASNDQRMQPVTVNMSTPHTPWHFVNKPAHTIACDCVLPMVHGTQGEDGTIQGLLSLLNIPYVGCDTLSSAICWHKGATKRILQQHGITVVPFYEIQQAQYDEASILEKFEAWQGTVFIKPARAGSSIGVAQVSSQAALLSAIQAGFEYDDCLLMEPVALGRECEMAVLVTQETTQVLGPGEVINHGGFYSYQAKYVDASLSTTDTDPDVSDDELSLLKQTALAAAKAVGIEGMVRVDGFLSDTGFHINELNTIPGFTDISLYPSLFNQAGVDSSELMHLLVSQALTRHQRDSHKKSVFDAALKIQAATA